MHHYPMIIEWSEEDRAFLVTVPDLPGCIADGATPEAALREAQAVIGLWIEVAREKGWPIPPPRPHLVVA
ncbi:MAG: type II toxin-antitoxin system HicB family antitoxin [Candidatus Thermoplasmatota archaeon]